MYVVCSRFPFLKLLNDKLLIDIHFRLLMLGCLPMVIVCLNLDSHFI